mgnify:CR=1 FL=1
MRQIYVGFSLIFSLLVGTVHAEEVDYQMVLEQVNQHAKAVGRTVPLAVQPRSPLANGQYRVVITVSDSDYVQLYEAEGSGCGRIRIGQRAKSPLVIEGVASDAGECTLSAQAVTADGGSRLFQAGFVVVSYDPSRMNKTGTVIENYRNQQKK